MHRDGRWNFLTGITADHLNSGGVLNVAGATLTMDDCATNQGTCSVPFEVESVGVLNIQGGNYSSEATVSANSVLNIKGGTYTGMIEVAENGVLNIGDENGGRYGRAESRTFGRTVRGRIYDTDALSE